MGKKPNIEEKNPQINKVSDLEGQYQPMLKKKMRFFSSFEEMNEADYVEMASFTPAQNFEQVTLLLEGFYAEELKMPMDKKVHFKK